jgi:DNA-binding GntR family transcriptional regulator
MQLIRQERLGQQLFELLRRRIVSGQIPGGRRLVQGALAAEMGVSRLPVRDALKRLEAEGLIEGDEFGRYVVTPFTLDDAAEVYAIRRRLEPLAAALAARRASEAELGGIRALFEEMEGLVREGAAEVYVDRNARFHAAIYEASGARRLVRMIGMLWSGIPPLTPLGLSGRMRNSHDEHRAIVERLLARDADGAAAAMEEHIRNAGEELASGLARRGDESGNQKGAPEDGDDSRT